MRGEKKSLKSHPDPRKFLPGSGHTFGNAEKAGAGPHLLSPGVADAGLAPLAAELPAVPVALGDVGAAHVAHLGVDDFQIPSGKRGEGEK